MHLRKQKNSILLRAGIACLMEAFLLFSIIIILEIPRKIKFSPVSNSDYHLSDKNLHDDAPDACAMLVDFLVGGTKTVTVARRPF